MEDIEFLFSKKQEEIETEIKLENQEFWWKHFETSEEEETKQWKSFKSSKKYINSPTSEE